jgi:hypothetical protein
MNGNWKKKENFKFVILLGWIIEIEIVVLCYPQSLDI